MKLVISDLHFGERNNSSQHNQDLANFFTWLKEWRDMFCPDCRDIVVAGDTFHHRDKLNVSTINASLDAFDIINDFHITMLKGNHDLYHRDRRDITSLEIFQEFGNIDIIDFYETEKNLMYTSWILDQSEYSEIIRKSKEHDIECMIGHFEFRSFRMNDNYVMEHGPSHKELGHVSTILTGHYHHRQVKDNVVYIGTPFPFNYSDANDSHRGFVLLDDQNDYAYIDYERISIQSIDYEEFLDMDTKYINPDEVSIRVVIGEVVDEKTLDRVKEKLENMPLRDSKIVHKVSDTSAVLEQTSDDSIEIMDLDTAVITQLSGMEDVPGIDKNLLVDLYRDVL